MAELPLFLVGSGIALFIAILAWGDQIRSIKKDTRELEKELVQTKNLPWQDIRFLIKSDSNDKDKIKALSNLMKLRKLKSKNIPQLFESFKKLNISQKNLELISKSKYQFAIYLTISFFVFGLLSLLKFNIIIPKINISIPSDLLFLSIPVIFILILFFKIGKCNKMDENFSATIEEVYNNLY